MDERPQPTAGEAWSVITEHADGSATVRYYAPPPGWLAARLLAQLGEPVAEHMVGAEEWAWAKGQQVGVVVTRGPD